MEKREQNQGKQWIKRLTAAFLTLLLISAGVLSGCTALNIGLNNSANDFVHLMESQDFGGLYDILYISDPNMNAEDFETRLKNIYSAIGVSKITISDRQIKQEDDRTFMEYTMTYETTKAGKLTDKYTVYFQQTGDGYQPIWQDSLIFPQMDTGDVVRVKNVSYKRGEIFTKDGYPVAINDYAQTIYLDATQDIDLDTALSSIGAVVELTDKELEKIKKDFSSAKENNYATCIVKAVAKDSLTSQQQEALLAITGVGIDEDSLTPIRYYPYKELYSHIAGYLKELTQEDITDEMKEQGYEAGDKVGTIGLEKEYESTLRGEDGFQIYIEDNCGAFKHMVYEKPVQNGQDIILNIDHQSQLIGYYKLNEVLEEGQSGVAIVMDGKTGAVETMADFPSYDNNIFSFAVSEEDWQKIQDTNAMYPLATQGLYPPGSIIKPFTVVPSLQEGIVDETTVFPGKIVDNKWTPDRDDWVYPPIGRVDSVKGEPNLENSLIYSDNIFFAWANLQLGEEKFMTYMKRTGFGEAFDFELPVSTSQLINEDTQMNIKYLADMAYGQGEMLITPIQAASMYTAFLNEGTMIKPKLIGEQKVEDGLNYNTVSEMTTEVFLEDVIDQESLATLQPILKKVVEEGTARSISRYSDSLYAKTGTAEVGSQKERVISWLAVYSDDPENTKVVLVMVDVPSQGGNVKFGVAQELLKNIFTEEDQSTAQQDPQETPTSEPETSPTPQESNPPQEEE